MKNIVLPDVHFKLGVRQVTGIIHAEQGIPMFYNAEEGIIARLPFPVTWEHYEMPVCVYMRPDTYELIASLGPDDRLNTEFKKGEVDVIADYEKLLSIFTDQKLRKAPAALFFMGVCALSSIAAMLTCLLNSIKVISTWIPAIISVVLFVITGVISLKYKESLDQKILYDASGKWINFETGYTNLGGGHKIVRRSRK